jgi:hypothetical protein
MVGIQSLHQSAGDGVPRVVIDAAGGCCWEVCTGGRCIRDRSGQRLRVRLQALRLEWLEALIS